MLLRGAIDRGVSLSLKRQIAGGALWSLMGSGGQQLLGFAVFVYLARVLAPEVFGLVAFGIIAVDIGGYVARWGQVELLQRDYDDRPAREAAAFWVAGGAGVVGTLVIAAAAGFFALFDDRAQLAQIFIWLSPVVLLQGLSAVPEAALRRNLQFKALALRNWAATAVAAVSAAAMAYVQPGPEVLLVQRGVYAVLQFALLWYFTPIKIGHVKSGEACIAAAKEGLQIVVSGLSSMINARMADLIAGAVLGARTLGLLRFGWRFNDLLSQVVVFPITSVTLGSFARLATDVQALQRAYLRMTQLMSLLALPAFFGAAAISERIIVVAFGPQWLEARVIIVALAPLILAGTVNQFFNSTMFAVGRADIVMRQSIGQLILTAVLVTAAASFGIAAVATAHCLRSLLVAIFNVFALKRVVGLAPARIFTAIAPPALCSSAMAMIIWFVNAGDPSPANSILGLVKMTALGALSYAGLLLLGDLSKIWPGYCRDVARSLAQLRR